MYDRYRDSKYHKGAKYENSMQAMLLIYLQEIMLHPISHTCVQTKKVKVFYSLQRENGLIKTIN